MKRAAIDLGTNTFHILIAEVNSGSINEILFKERQYVFLAEDGLDKLSETVFERAESAAHSFRRILDEYQISDIRIIGTEGLRKASNGPLLAKRLEDIFRQNIQIISGEEEARLIGKGVEMVIDNSYSGISIDIGGGSTELIAIDKGKAYSHISQACGIGHLYNLFHQNEPLTKEGLDGMVQHIRSAYLPFLKNLTFTNDDRLTVIGVAGSFEALVNMSKRVGGVNQSEVLEKLDISFVKDLLDRLAFTTLNERNQMNDIPAQRRKYIVEALVIINTIYDILPFKQMVVSQYSIKHGLLVD